MNKDQNSFFSDLLQNLGFIATAIVAVTQYSLSSSFQFLFKENVELLKISSLVALITSMAIFIGLFALRFSFNNKIYLKSKSKDKYLEELSKMEKGSNQYVSEPKYFNLLQLAFVFIFLCLTGFTIALISTNDVLTAIMYILFIDFSIASLSIFSIQLYREREIVKKRDDSYQLILNKIREYFIGDIQITYDSTDPYQFIGPNRHIIFEYKNKKYDVFTKSYDPESYFNLIEHQEVSTN